MNLEELQTCFACGTSEVNSYVQYGSYFTRCTKCGQGAATSWLALSEKLTGHCRAVVIDADQNEVELIGEGQIAQIADAIAKAARQGKLVFLLSLRSK